MRFCCHRRFPGVRTPAKYAASYRLQQGFRVGDSLFTEQLMFKSVRSVFGRFGLFRALHFAFYRFLQRLMILDVEHVFLLDAPSREDLACRIPGVVVRSLDPDKVRAFSANPDNDLDPTMLDRIALPNNYCFAAIDEGCLAGYAWFALEFIPAAHNRGSHPLSGVGLGFPSHMAYMYKGFVLPKYRGNDIYGFIIARAREDLHEQGVTQLFCNADWTNYSAIRSCRNVGYKSLGYVWRFGFAWKMFTVSPRAARRYGISFTS
jgi:hypothetical protein